MPPQATPLVNTLGDAWNRCRSILQGNSSQYGLYQRDYLLPFIQQAYEDIESCIKNATSKQLEAVIEVLNVQPGTTDYSPLQSYGNPNQNPPGRGPLVGLNDPIRLWVKAAGALPQYYVPVRGPKDYLPHVNPPGLPVGTYGVILEWAWIGGKLFVTAASAPIDIQVYGRFNAPPLIDANDKLVLYPRLTAPLAYTASALTGVERSNTTILQGYAERGSAMVDNIVADLIRQTQGNQRRPARMGRGGEGWSGFGWAGNF